MSSHREGSAKGKPRVPADYVVLEGSERRPSPSARLLGPADPQEQMTVTIVLRRRPDGEPVPDFDHFLTTPPAERPRLSADEFAAKYGASPEDIDKVTEFVTKQGMTVESTNAARRAVVASGTVEQMSKAFAVALDSYEHEIVVRRGEKPVNETYRGRDGSIHIPKALADILVGVFGLDNRRITKHNAADPPNTNPLAITTITSLYNFPTNSASGQTIGIFSEAGYMSSDINTSFGGSPPTITDVTVDASNDGSADVETTQDIVIAAKAASGAAIAVYFTTYTQQGWVDLIGRVAHPQAGDPVCSVLSSSFYVANGDDSGTLSAESVSTNWLTAATQAFQDAAIQGITVCIASGDTGTDSKVGDGKAHVQYPASDPWVLSVGGTTIGNVSGSSFDEYVWNDPAAGDSTHWGTTGGGVSDFFAVPSYQSGAGVPASINDSTHHGRGVPDVAGNASLNAGYTGITVNGSSFTGNGTSASAPLWAGLIAVINAALGVNVGFVNPALYAVGSAGFNDITGAAGPTDNSNGGVSGYPAGTGWDACTGWGSPNGVALLNALRSIYTRSAYFIVDKSTYGKDEVADVISTGGGLYSNAFWVVVEGFSITQLGAATPAISGPFESIAGVTVFPDAAGAQYESPGDLYTPQRVRFPYNVIFSSAALSALSAFPASGAAPVEDVVTASITAAGATVSGQTLFQLVSGADPYFTNIDPNHDNAFWLSQDLRVFTAANGDAPIPGGPVMSGSDPYNFIQRLIGFLNSTPSYTTPGPDPLNALPGQTGYETGDSSVTPLDGANRQNFNFAVARVRLQDAPLASADNVRVFFRLWTAVSCDTDFQPSTRYKSTLGTTGADAGKPVFPLPSGTGLMDPSGQSIQTIPFFATDANGTHDYDSTVSSANIRNIQIPALRDKLWAYFGCFLDVYNGSNQSKFGGTHHCLVAEIAYDDAPIVNAGGVTMSPENSDKLAQRNLQITSSGNPSYPQTHRVPQAFDTRASEPVSATPGALLDYPDELMVDWGNTPTGSVASVYWPQVDAADVVALASKLYGEHPLTAAEANTIRCPVKGGVTYIPILPGIGKSFAGLFTVDLPSSVRIGQEFRITVRRIATRRADTQPGAGPPTIFREGPPVDAAAESSWHRGKTMRNWRYITGTFQVTIPVASDEALLLPEETALAVLKWRHEHMEAAYRWFPVLDKLLGYVGDRVDGFGGDAAGVGPSLQGFPRPHVPWRGPKRTHRGKVEEIVYDCFGDLEGFVLVGCCAEREVFECREASVGSLLLRACKDDLRVAVVVDEKRERRICEIRISR